MSAATAEALNEDCLLRPGNTNCAGCGIRVGLRMLGRALAGERYSMVIPACCGIVSPGLFPYSAYGAPVVASTFASASPLWPASSGALTIFS